MSYFHTILKNGLFITLEGIEGCGKTTQSRLLEDYLRCRGRKVVLTREPGGTPIGEILRAILLDPGHSRMEAVTELLLYEAARAQHVREVIRPAIDQGKVVVCDRFTDATIAYQGAGRGLPVDWIVQINTLICDGLTPDLTLLFDCPAEVGLRRARGRGVALATGITADRFEQEESAFHQRVRNGYLAIVEREPDRLIVIDGTKDVDTVHQRVVAAVLERLS